eukprot:evm.model.NODE_32489_length_25912_cov_24.063213.5
MLRTAVLLLLGGLGMLGAHAADPGLGSYMYGLRKINGTRWIVQYNPPIQQLEVVFDTGLDDSNALAFDTLRDQLIFLGEDFSNVESLYVWDIATETMTLIAPWAPLAAALGMTTTDSAAFYNNAYWFVPERTAAAAQIIFIYTNGIPTGIASYNKYDFADQTVAPLMRFGDIAIDVPRRLLYGASTAGLIRVDLSNLAVPLPFVWVSGPDEDLSTAQCAFNADFSTLWGYRSNVWFIIDTQTGAFGTPVWIQSGPSDLGGSSFFGSGGGGGACYTQYAAVKTKAAKSAKRGGYLRYRATVKIAKNSTVSSINDLRFEVTLPSELSVVSSSSSLKRQGVTATVGPSSVWWTTFNLDKKRKTARFGLKLSVASTAASRQVLDITGTLMHERDGGLLCPQFFTRQVRVK